MIRETTTSFVSRDRAEAMAYSLGTEVIDWNTLQEKYRAGEIGVGMAGAAMTMGEHEGLQVQEIVLGEAEVAGAILQLIAHEPLHTGYNAVAELDLYQFAELRGDGIRR